MSDEWLGPRSQKWWNQFHLTWAFANTTAARKNTEAQETSLGLD
jgi:hypothetical protein